MSLATDALEAAYHAEAEATAAQHNYDATALRFHYGRYQFGSLSNNWEAPDMRRKFWRAWIIAVERDAAAERDILQAAE